jgi:hypothetical protein
MEDDTHPSAADRFRYIEGITSAYKHEDDSMVKDLFANWDMLTDEMTKIIEDRVKEAR